MQRRHLCIVGPLAALLLLPLLATGCQTTVGNYFANRGRDLGECFLVQVGGGVGLGVDVKAAGVAHADALASIYFPGWSFGWVYGEPRPDPDAGLGSSGHFPSIERDMGLGVVHSQGRGFDGVRGDHLCFALLPGILSWESTDDLSRQWIWTDIDQVVEDYEREIEEITGLGFYAVEWRRDRSADVCVARQAARLHLFDIEAGVFALFVGARAGFSPGEFLDFLLGWVGVDIAGDDREVVREEAEPLENEESEKEESG